MTYSTQADKAYCILRDSIIHGQFLAGYPLTETELAKTLEMSRTPVREAILRLCSEGLLENIARKGVVPRQFTPEQIRQAYEYAEALEGKLVWLLTRECNQRDFPALEACVVQMEQAIEQGDIDAWIKADYDYHDVLWAMSTNSFIKNALKSVNGNVYYTRMLVTKVRLDKRKSTKDHRETLTHMKAGNAELARTVTEKHWRRILREVMAVLEDKVIFHLAELG